MDYFKEILDQASAAIDDSRESKFTELTNHGVVCSETGKPIIGASRYYASYKTGDDLKEVHLSEQAFSEPSELDYLPLVYFRLTHPLKDGQQLPLVDLSKLYKKEGDFMFEIKVKSNYLYYANK